MTTWESIDKIEKTDNLTLTSDASYERVTNDEHFEEERDWGYLQQNTSWLVQEIPNISFLDIADTFLESKKTLVGREWHTLIVWNLWKSIETVWQDTLNIRLWEDKTISSSPALVQLDTYNLTPDSDKIEVDENHIWRINILRDWYYRISYGWTVDLQSATQLSMDIYKKNERVMWDIYSWVSGKLSWWRTISLQLNHDDYIYMRVDANAAIKVCEEFTYLEIQYVRPTI